MPFVRYRDIAFRDATMATIARARDICEDYAAQGYNLTLRQLYYQFVARGWMPNRQTEYDRLGSIVNDARLAGLLDWNWITDRTRNPKTRSTWDHPRDIIEASARQFHLDYWADQPVHVEVWVEKEALAGVVEDACWPLSVTTLACRGYMSQSEQWTASRRFTRLIKDDKRVVVLHLGDHDPSGMDMSRDNAERLRDFIQADLASAFGIDFDPEDDPDYRWELLGDLHRDHPTGHPPFQLKRIALNWDQIQQYSPPPNPAKMTDSRASGYVERFGRVSWELDALPPNVLAALITDEVEALRDDDIDLEVRQREVTYRQRVADLLELHGDVLDS